MALVWPGSKEPTAAQRRVILTGQESAVQALNDEEISFILGTLDAVTPSTHLSVGLFGVFPVWAKSPSIQEKRNLPTISSLQWSPYLNPLPRT